MDEKAFQEAVCAAKAIYEGSGFLRLTWGEALATALVPEYPSRSAFISVLIPISERDRWAWETLSSLAQKYIDFFWEEDHEFWPWPEDQERELLPKDLALWVSAVLAGVNPKPPNGGKREARRDLAIAETVVFVMDVYGLKATRNAKGLPECCAEGGSACDVVGAAVGGLGIKAVIAAWDAWKRYTHLRLSEQMAHEPWTLC